MRMRPWVRGGIAALIGAVAMLVLGQLFSFAGGTCMILCRPPIAALYGAAMGLLLLGSARNTARTDQGAEKGPAS
jgi:hypothetical protein